MTIAVKNLVAERTRFVLSVLGVGFAVLLVLVMAGIFVGTTNQVTTYIDHSKGAVWVTQPGVTQMFKSVSWLPADDRDRLMQLPEVKSADPILGQPSDFVHAGTHTAYFLVGYDIQTGVGGPWSLSQGRTINRSGEVVLDRVLAKKNNIHLGDRVQILDEHFTVVGLSNQTAAVTNYYSFLSLSDASRLMRAGSRVSYFLVQPQSGYSDAQVIDAIQHSSSGMNALSSASFAHNSRDIVVKMIGRPLKTMIAIAVVVGIALVGLTVLTVTTEQMRDFAVLRALGARSQQLRRTVVAQAAILAAAGYTVGATTAYVAQFVIRDAMGDVTVEITPAMLGAMAAVTALMAALGAIVPIRRITKIDPALAFRR